MKNVEKNEVNFIRRNKKKDKINLESKINKFIEDENEFHPEDSSSSEDFSEVEENEHYEDEENEHYEDEDHIDIDNDIAIIDDNEYIPKNLEKMDISSSEEEEEEEEETKEILDFNLNYKDFQITKKTFKYSTNDWQKIFENNEIFDENNEKNYFYENLFGFNGDKKIIILDLILILINLKIKKKITIDNINIFLKMFKLFNLNKKFPKNWKKLSSDFLNNNNGYKKIIICGKCFKHIFMPINFKNENLNEDETMAITCPDSSCKEIGFYFKNKKWNGKSFIYHFSIGIKLFFLI
jgi:hypothetical protein